MLEKQMIALLREAAIKKNAQYIVYSARAKMLKRQLVEAIVKKNLMNEVDASGAGLVRSAPVQSGVAAPPAGASMVTTMARAQRARQLAGSIASVENELPDADVLANAAEEVLSKARGVSSGAASELRFITDTNFNNNTYARLKNLLIDTESARSELENMYQDNMNKYTDLQSKYEKAIQAAEQAREQGMTAQSLIDFISGPGYAQLSPEEQRRARSAFREYVTGETRRRRERRAAARSAKT